MRATNLLLRFLLELSALAALGYGGARLGGSTRTKSLFAAGAVSVAALAWGGFVAPNASADVHPAIRWAVELTVFGAAAGGLAACGRARLAAVVAVLYAANRALMAAWDQ